MFARLKRYMQAEDRWIDLDELVQSEAERVASRLTSERFRFDRDAFGRETFVARATDYETIVKTLARCLLMGAYWGRSAHDKMWLSALQRTVPETEYAAGNMGWIDLADYPALQLFYALGLGAVAAGRAGLAIQVLKGGRVRYAHTDRPWVSRLHQWFVQDTNWFRWLPGLEGRPAPVSERLWQLGAMLRADIKVEPGRYDEVFDDWVSIFRTMGPRLFRTIPPRVPHRVTGGTSPKLPPVVQTEAWV